MFRDRFGSSLRFCQVEFDNEAISVMVSWHISVLLGMGGGLVILSKFRELSFCGPSGWALKKGKISDPLSYLF